MRRPISADVLPGADLDQLAFVHDEDPVVERQDLIEGLADQQHRRPFFRGFDEQRVHRLDGGHIRLRVAKRRSAP